MGGECFFPTQSKTPRHQTRRQKQRRYSHRIIRMNPLRAATRILFVLALLISDLHADPRPDRTIPDGSDTGDRCLKLIARPQVPFTPNERPPSSSDGLTKIGFDFAAEANQRVPGLMIRSINLILPCPNSMGFCSQRNIIAQKRNDQRVRFPASDQNR
jgi:hypothetical protein